MKREQTKTITQWSSYYHHVYFADRKTNEQRGHFSYLGHGAGRSGITDEPGKAQPLFPSRKPYSWMPLQVSETELLKVVQWLMPYLPENRLSW